MKTRHFAALAVVTLFAAVAFAGDRHHTMEIKIVSDSGDGEKQVVIDSADLDFNMHEMQVGENQSVVDKNGTPVLITRTEDGFTLEVDGETVDVPAFGGPHGKDGAHPGVVHRGIAPHAMAQRDGVMIISGKEIDEATQQVIRSALEAAGHENVRFSGGKDGGPHEIHVISKLVEVTE